MSAPFPSACCYLTGPTASGKTTVGVELARRLGAEVLSLDSMAVYRRLDVGTAKPPPAEQRGVPHHLIDLVEPDAEFSLAEYLRRARDAVEAIRVRGRVPLFVGGSPLYLKALLRGVFEGPAADWEFRRDVEREAAERGAAWLHGRLAAVDPASAQRLHPRDQRRIIRALEVHRLTGQPISALQAQFERPRDPTECRVFLLVWPRETLYARIDARVDAMFRAGWVEEVRGLTAVGHRLGRTAAQAVGYREILDHLAGRASLDATITTVKTRTRQFAKRQLTWFRSLAECRPVECSAEVDAAELAARIAALGWAGDS